MIPADQFTRAAVHVYTHHLDDALDALAEATRRGRRAILIRTRRRHLPPIVDADALRQAHEDLTRAIATAGDHMATVARASRLIETLRAEDSQARELPTPATIAADLDRVDRAIAGANRLATLTAQARRENG